MVKRISALLLVIVLMVFNCVGINSYGSENQEGSFDIRVRTGCYVDEEGYFIGVSERVTKNKFLEYFTEGQNITVDKVATSGVVEKTINNAVTHRATIVIKGDVTGDGKVSTSDYMLVKRSFGENKTPFEGAFFKAADIDGNNRISSRDYLVIKSYFNGKYDLYPEPEITVYDPEATATVYQLGAADDALMMSYLIVTPAGKTIMIDGGMTGSSNLYNTLYTQLKKFGNLVAKDNVIDAWIFTHPHNDHVKAFCQVWKQHPEIEVKNFYFNFPSEEEILSMPSSQHIYTDDLNMFINVFNQNMGSETAYENYPKTQAGDSFIVDGIKFDILQTYNSAGSTYNNLDDCSMVVRMTVGQQSVLFLGDLTVDAGRDLLDTYGSGLKSDIVQMSRHGQNGVEKDVYEAVEPDICLWPTPLWVWNTNSSTQEIKGWMQDLGVKYHNTMREGWLDENYNSLNLSDNSIAIPSDYVVK